MSVDLRIHNALREIYLTNGTTHTKFKGFEIHLGQGAYRELLRETVIAVENPTYKGLPVKVNLNFADGEIVLRYEVKA